MSLVPPDFVEPTQRAEVGCPMCGAVDQLVFFRASGGVPAMFACRPCTRRGADEVGLGDLFDAAKGYR